MEEKLIIGGIITIASLVGVATINTVRGMINNNKKKQEA